MDRQDETQKKMWYSIFGFHSVLHCILSLIPYSTVFHWLLDYDDDDNEYDVATPYNDDDDKHSFAATTFPSSNISEHTD